VKRVLFFYIFLLWSLTASAQSQKQPITIESKVHTGIILPVYKAINYLIQDNIYALDFSLGFPTYGEDYWEKLYRYPRSGAGYSYWSLGNRDILGEAHGLYSYLNVPFFRQGERFSFNYQISFGGAYITKKFDKNENPLNRAIGSNINVYIRLGIDGKVRLTPRCELILETGITHFSNGKTRSPNYGINAGSFSLGVNYLFGNDCINKKDPQVPGIEKQYVQSVVYSAGSKVYDNLLGKRYFTSSVSYNLERALNSKKKIGLGGDFFYDNSISEALADEDGTPEKEFAKLIRTGLHASYSVQYKHLIMGIQAGHYLYSKYTVLTRVYTKVSLQYLFTSNIAGDLTLKSHMGKADCLEYGLVYYW